MTSMDDGLLSTRKTPRRKPSQRILEGLGRDRRHRWQRLRSRPWTTAVVALFAPCVLFSFGMYLHHRREAGDSTKGAGLPAIQVTPHIAGRLTVASFPLEVVLPRPRVIRPVITVRWDPPPPALAALPRRPRAAVARSEDITVLSVLMEHIDAERRASVHGRGGNSEQAE